MQYSKRILRIVLPLLAVAMGVTAAFVWRTMLSDLPPVADLAERAVRPTTRILDRNGLLLYEVLDPNAGKQLDLRQAVSAQRSNRYGLADVPDFCVEATLATEDSRFYFHPGVDPVAIVRAALQNYRAGGEIVSGGSTLTQQVARNLLMEPSERYERSLRRKIREAWLALQIEWHYTKPQILLIYLNQTYYGNFAFGLGAASEIFFAKPAAQLSRAECALLAGLVQYPSGYNPFQDAQSAKLRQQTVLRLMVEAGYIDEEELAAVLAEPLRYRSNLFAIEAPHFVMYVQDLLIAQLGQERLRNGGLEVRTSLDLGLQRQAEASVRRRLAQLNCHMDDVPGYGTQSELACAGDGRERRVKNAAAVVIDTNTGDILAMVGSPDYFDASIEGNVNAALSQRQPGSAIKPFTYAAALDPTWSERAGLERPMTPASILPDVPTTFPGGRGEELLNAVDNRFEDGVYVPKNYDLRYHGPVSVREALANSYNIPAVYVLQHIGVSTLQRLAAQAGISSFTGEYGLALTLGGGEVSLLDLTKAYGIFPRGGERLETRAILEISELHAEGKSKLYFRSPGSATRLPVISQEAAYLITDILADPVARMPAFGAGSPLNLPFPAAAKTGTTTDWRDNWTVGYTSQQLVGVWVGNADNRPMQGISGIDGAGPIWHDLMRASHRTTPPPFQQPARLVELTICAPSGLLPSSTCPRLRREHFIAGTEPTRPDDQFQRIAIDGATGRRATAETPTERVVERTYWLLGPAYDDWMRAQGIPQPPPPCNPQDEECGTSSAATSGADRGPRTNHSPLFLAAPAGNSTYVVHPGMPMDRQRIAVGGYVADGKNWSSLRLMVDGEPIVTAVDAVRLDGWWTLTPGRHIFWLEGEMATDSPTIRSFEATIVVE